MSLSPKYRKITHTHTRVSIVQTVSLLTRAPLKMSQSRTFSFHLKKPGRKMQIYVFHFLINPSDQNILCIQDKKNQLEEFYRGSVDPRYDWNSVVMIKNPTIDFIS